MTAQQRADRVEIVMGELPDGVEYVKHEETYANIAAAIEAAVSEERERCARIADTVAETDYDDADPPADASLTAMYIAANIRATKTPGVTT